jgi:RNA polymerase sigma factor (sigma-70 family)
MGRNAATGTRRVGEKKKPANKRKAIAKARARAKAKKEKEKARRKQERKRPPLTKAQQELATRYLPMAKALAKPLKAAWPGEADEFDSAACLALVEAAQSFDPRRKVVFGTFARYRIWGALRDVQRALIAPGWEGDLEHAPVMLSLQEGIEEQGRVLNAEPDRPVEEVIDSLDAAERLLSKLPRKYAAACREIYVNDRTQEQAARIIGCSKSRVAYLLKGSQVLLNDPYPWKHPDGEFHDGDFDDDLEKG